MAATQQPAPATSGRLAYKGVIVGKVVSKANSRRRTRSGLYIKSADGLAFERLALQQIPGNLQPITGDVLLLATIYYPSLRQDLDESLVMDVLQQRKDKAGRVYFNGVYVNDRQIKAKLILHAIDRENPRVEFEAHQINGGISEIVLKYVKSTTYN